MRADLRIINIVSFVLFVATCAVCLSHAGVAGAAETKSSDAANPASSPEDERWQSEGWELMQQFCLDCHNDAYQEAELDLSRFDTVEGLMTEGNGMTAEHVLNMVRFGAMPPEDYDLPTDEERKRLVEALDAAIFSIACDLRPKPGKVTARRLNRAEYNNAIRDLFGTDLKPADAFPSDEVGGGFDNNGDVLSLSTMLIEKYFDAAESVARAVLVDPADLPIITDEAAGDRLIVEGKDATGSFYGRFLAPDAFVWTEFDVPASGTFSVEVSSGMTMEDSDEGTFGLFDEDGVLLDTFVSKYYGGGGGGGGRGRSTIHLNEGKRRLIIAPLVEPDDWKIGVSKLPAAEKLTKQRLRERRKLVGKGLKPDRGFDREALPYMVRKVVLSGPKDFDEPVYPPSQWVLLKEQPERRGDRYRDVTEAAEKNLKPLMRRAFRGPVSDDDVQAYAGLVKDATDRGDSFVAGMRIAITGILVSPKFLFRVESPPEDAAARGDVAADSDGDDEIGVMRLTSHQLATRMSFFLWSSLPDDRLLQLADENQLHDPETLRREVKRMLADEKARSLATEFASQWFGLRNLDVAEPDAERFKGFDADLLPRMARETETLFMHLVRNNLPVGDLLTADYSFVDAALAKYYGLENAGDLGDQFQRVSLAATPRRGLLGHAGVLTLTSNPTRTSPVIRGKWILENILGTPPPEPPPGVPELEETQTADATASLREQMEIHRSDPSCAACHRVMDQLGFGLEQFDAVGRYREKDGKFPVDASGELPGGRSFSGAQELSEVLGRSEQKAFADTATKRLLTFALGRELKPSDRCVVDEIVNRCAETDYRVADLITEVIQSRPFQYYEWTDEAPIADN